VTQERALAAAAASHDDKNISAVDGEIKIPLEHKAAVRHLKVLNNYMGFLLSHNYLRYLNFL
jgi:hypothetical protein